MSRILKTVFVGFLVVIGATIISSQSGLKSAQGVDADHVFSLLEERNGEEFDSPKGKKAIASAVAYLEMHGVTAYDFGRDLYYKDNYERSVFWYEALSIATDEPKYFYGRAYFEWVSGHTEEALRDVTFLLEKPLSTLIKARSFYLRGRINLQSRFLDAAEADFYSGLESYKSLEGKYGGQYLCLTLLANVAIYKKEYQKVEPLLKAAMEADRKSVEIGLKPYGMSVIHEIYGELYFEQRKFQDSLEENKKSQAAYLEDDLPKKAEGILVKIGLLMFITGDPKAAHKTASGIWTRLENTSRTRLWAYNNVTLAMLALCSNQMEDRQVRKDEALSWARADAGGQALIELIEFLENEIPCPEIKE